MCSLRATASEACGSGQTWPHQGAGLGAAILTALLLLPVAVGQARPVLAAGDPVSAVGNEAPLTFAVSPNYAQTRMVAAVTAPLGGCSSACEHLWITRDGGASWHRAGASSPPGARMVIDSDAGGAEVLVAAGHDGVMASRDDGASWQRIGALGAPMPAPWLGSGALLVAGLGGPDYVVSAGGAHDVDGSGTADDLAFGATGLADTPALLAARDRASGLPEIMRCDAALACSGAALLPGASAQGSGDTTVSPAADFAGSGRVFARTTTALYTSTDGGRTFVGLTLPPQVGAQYTTIPAIALDPRQSRSVYAAVLALVGTGGSQLTSGGVFASQDAGATWRAVGSPGPLDGGATAVAAAPDGRLFAGYVDSQGHAGLVCDDGAGWQAACGAAATPCVAAQCAAPVAVAAVAAPDHRPVTANSGSNAAANSAGREPDRSVSGASSTGHAALAPPRRPLLPELAGAALLGGAVVLLLVSRRRARPHRRA